MSYLLIVLMVNRREVMGQIKLITNILKSNEEFSIKNKNILKNKDIFTINIMSSPGSGKTSILEKLIEDILLLHPA